MSPNATLQQRCEHTDSRTQQTTEINFWETPFPKSPPYRPHVYQTLFKLKEMPKEERETTAQTRRFKEVYRYVCQFNHNQGTAIFEEYFDMVISLKHKPNI